MNDNNSLQIDLVADPTFTTKVRCQIPSAGVDAWRELEFEATFKVLSETEQEELPLNITVRDVLRRVLFDVKGIPEAKTREGEVLSPVEVVIRNAFTSDAAHAVYKLRTTKNGRDISTAEAMKAGTTRGNSSRSRPR